MKALLGGSWVAMSEVMSPLTWIMSMVTLLMTLLMTTHEPPSMNLSKQKNPQPEP